MPFKYKKISLKDREIAENTIQAPLVLKQLKEVLSDGKILFLIM